MKLKIVTSLLLSIIISGCTTYTEQTNSKVNKKSKSSLTTSKAVKPKTSVKTAKTTLPKQTVNLSQNVDKKEDKSSNMVVLSNTSSLDKKSFEIDKQSILLCEKKNLCLKEIVIIENYMLFKVEMTEELYSNLKNKDNVITYFNNDVKTFKSNPDLYLKKYGLIHKKYANANDMLRNLQEVQIKDIFGSKIFVRFKPF